MATDPTTVYGNPDPVVITNPQGVPYGEDEGWAYGGAQPVVIVGPDGIPMPIAAATNTLIEEVVADGTTLNLSVANIPQTFKALSIEFVGALAAVTGQTAFTVRFNDDSAANYLRQRHYSANTTQVSEQQVALTGFDPLLTGMATPQSIGMLRITIPNYNSTTRTKVGNMVSEAMATALANGFWHLDYGVFWNNAAAINKVSIIGPSAFTADSKLRVHGIG